MSRPSQRKDLGEQVGPESRLSSGDTRDTNVTTFWFETNTKGLDDESAEEERCNVQSLRLGKATGRL